MYLKLKKNSLISGYVAVVVIKPIYKTHEEIQQTLDKCVEHLQ